MSRDPLTAVSTVTTPQTRRVPGRPDQVLNNAGGYGFGKDLWTRFEDFLVLGTAGGTHYLGEDKLTADNADVVFGAVRADGERAVALLTNVSASRPPRAPKNRGCMFALAAASATGDPATVQAVKPALPQGARTTDHLSMFFGYRKQLKGKPIAGGTAPIASRAYRSALAGWFLAADVNAVAWKACKARQRKTPAGEPMALRDILRIAHPGTCAPEMAALFGWLAGNVGDADAGRLIPEVDAFLTAQAVTTPAGAVRVITDLGVPWEFLPGSVTSAPEVWEALAENAGMTALLRNLARMTRIGTLGPYAAANATVVRRLRDAEAIRGARIHPMDVYLALRVYNSGVSKPDPKKPAVTWNPVGEVSDALEDAYGLSFGAVEPSGRRLAVAVDSSSSMSGNLVTMGGSPLGSAYEVGNAMAAMLKRIEGPNAHVFDVDLAARPSRITSRTNLREIAGWRADGGGTDLSLPFAYLAQYDLRVDGLCLFTDNETWAGRQHPFQALAGYRARYNPGARVIIAAMTAAGHTIGDPKDAGVLNLAGMDASLPTVVTGFIR